MPARPPEQLHVARVASIRDPGVLINSQDELDGLVRLLESLCDRVEPVTTLDDLRSRVLRTADYDVLDFVAHMSVDIDQGRSGLKLAEGSFNAHEPLTDKEWKFVKRAPLVFVNGCSATRESRGIFQSTSFPKLFLDLGASCFVGSSVPVLAPDALRFAKALYEELNRGTEIGEATRRHGGPSDTPRSPPRPNQRPPGRHQPATRSAAPPAAAAFAPGRSDTPGGPVPRRTPRIRRQGTRHANPLKIIHLSALSGCRRGQPHVAAAGIMPISRTRPPPPASTPAAGIGITAVSG